MSTSPRISLDEVYQTATLAQLALTPDEAAQLERDLGQILDAMDVLRQVPTANVAAMTHMATTQALRVDAPQPSLDATVVLAAAPAVKAGHFVVPSSIGDT